MPREPSTQRIAVWRKLKRLGVARISDGLAALPADARTREHFDWLAEEIRERGGSAAVWLATPGAVATERDLASAMAAARAAEYAAVCEAATAAYGADVAVRRSTLRRLRGELRRINRRDYFPPAEREQARAAVERLVPSIDLSEEENIMTWASATLEEQP